MRNDQSKTKPVAQVRLGNISAAIWRNDSGNGPWFNVTIARSYRENDDYRSAQTFGRDDLLKLAKVCDLANTRIYKLQAEERRDAA